MEEKIRLSCSVCQAAIRVRAATKARFAICPKCQARTPIPERDRVNVEITSPLPGPATTPAPAPAPAPDQEFTRADLAPASEARPLEIQEPEPVIDQHADTPPASPAVEAPPEAPAEAPAEPPAPEAPAESAPAEEEPAPAEEAPKKGALPGRRPGTRPLPGKRSTTMSRRGLPGKEGEGAPKKGGSKILWIVVFLVVLLGGGAGLFFSGLLGGGGAKTEATTNPVDTLFKAVQSKNVDAIVKLVKGAPEKYKDNLKAAFDGLDQYDLTYKITKTAGTTCSVEWSLKYKVKPSADPGGETDPKTQETPPSTDDVTFEADGVSYDNLPVGFPMPKKLMPK